MWAKMSDAELIAQSDLIVVGEWVGQSAISLHGTARSLGAVAVSEVLKGDPRQTLALISLPASDAPVASDRVVFKRGDKGLWLLRRADAPGLYLADHPQRFVPAGSAGIESLRKAILRR